MNEKFTDQSDPIKDMGIGMMHQIKVFLKNTIDKIDTDDKNILLVYCAKYNKTEYAKFLIEDGADLHAFGELILEWAIQNDNTELVKFLIDSGADVHGGILKGSIIRNAIHKGNEEIIKMVKEAGATELSDEEHKKELKKLGRKAWKIQQQK